MQTRHIFLKDPLSWHLANEGVSSNNETNLDTLRYELETFVCQGEYHTGISRILQSYLGSHDSDQAAAWISGFYGSGKSHLVKVLRYLWTDFKFDDGATARTLTRLPADVKDDLKELSTLGKQGVGLLSAGGTLKAGVGSPRLRLLGLLFQSVGLPERVSQARFVMDLREEGKWEAVETDLRAAGKDPTAELGKLYTSKALQQAYLDAHPHLGNVGNVSAALRATYPTKVEDVSINDLVALIRRAIGRKGELPCTVIVLDEVQQFINNSADTALEVQEVVEACSKMLDGRVMFVGTGQSALTDTPALQRLMGRFSIKVHLKDNDVEKVIRTMVLQKKDARKKNVETLVSRQSGEITRQLKSTKLATRSEDDAAYVPDFPLLPVRRRFWEKVLHSVDPSGAAAQMRTQLRVTHEACRSVADKPLGAVIPGDFLYDQLANDLVIAGEMQKRFQEIIEEQASKPDGKLRGRICALVFLINKLPREGADTGVRATPEHLADLLTQDLGPSSTDLREKLPALVEQLATEGVLMGVDGEYRLQTTEGAAWESEYRRRRAALLNNDAQLAAHRAQLLSKALQRELSSLAVLHGAAKERRKAVLHHAMEPPSGADGLVVWVRDGFQESENAVIQDVQARSVEDATVHVFVPKRRADELKSALASSLAAEETLNFKGAATTQEGQEARSAILTRKTNEDTKVEHVLGDIVRGARVFLSGGQELPVLALKEAVESGLGSVLARLYPKFGTADSSNWPTVWRKTKEGSASALAAVNYTGDPDKHPVAAEILRFVGGGKRGKDVVSQFTAPPYGWPKDAIDATLAALLVSGHLGARLQGRPVGVQELDQRKASQADYRVEHPVLTALQKLRIKKLFQEAGHKFQPGDDAGAARAFVQLLGDLARSAGGETPAPEAPRPPLLIDLEGRTGNDLLFALFEKADDLAKDVRAWRSKAERLQERLTAFHLAERLLGHAGGRPGIDAHVTSLGSIRSQRSLLDDPDPVAPVLQAVGADLRAALQDAYARYESALADQRSKLEPHTAWTALDASAQGSHLAGAGVTPRSAPQADTDEDLVRALEVCSLETWGAHTNALPTCFAQALAAAIKATEPKARRITLPSGVVKTPKDVEDWVARARDEVMEAIKDGPVIL